MLLAFLVATCPQPGRASGGPVLILNGPTEAADLGPYIEYLIDPGWQLTVAALAGPDMAGAWQPLEGTTPDFGYTTARIWLRLAMANRTEQVEDWRLFLQANFFPSLQAGASTPTGRSRRSSTCRRAARSPPDRFPIHR